MAKKQKALRVILREITYSADRSSLFWWMVENHAELVAASAGRRLQWRPLCDRFARLGLTDHSGQVASERTARATWERARRVIAETRKREAERPPASRVEARPPSRMSREWRPSVVSYGSAPATVAIPSFDPVPQALTVDDLPTVDPAGAPLSEGRVWYRDKSLSRHAAEQLLRIDRGFDKLDRFK